MQDDSGQNSHPEEPLVDKRRTYSFRIDDAVVDIYGRRIGVYGIAVYSYLARRAKYNKSFPGIRRIANDLAIGAAKAHSTLKHLCSEGLIAITPRRTSSGDADTNLYELLDLSHLRGVSRGDTRVSRGDTRVSQPDTQVYPVEIHGVSRGDTKGVLFENYSIKESQSKGKTLSANLDLSMNEQRFFALQDLIRSAPWSVRQDARSFHDHVAQVLGQFLKGIPVQREYAVPERGDGSQGRIDIFINTMPPVAIELDDASPRKKSIIKLLCIDGHRLVGLRTFCGDPAQVWPGVAVIGANVPYDAHDADQKRATSQALPTTSPQLEILNVTEFPPTTTEQTQPLSDAGTVLAHLNALTNRSYRVTKYIAARLKDDYSVKECCLVLEWLHVARRVSEPEWVERYLDHTTPFREANFDKYLQRAREWETQGRVVPQPTNRRAPTHGLTDKEYNTVASAAELAQELLHGERRRPTFPQITR